MYHHAAEALQSASPTADPPSLIEHAHQPGRFATLAIGSLDRDPPTAPEGISDSLAHLPFTCAFAARASRHGK